MIFENAIVITMNPQRQIITHGTVVVDEDRIAEVGKSRDVAGKYPQKRRIDCNGKVLMPGLIDAHYHAYAAEIDLPLLDSLPMSYLSQRAGKLLEASLMRGFTTIRDVGGAD